MRFLIRSAVPGDEKQLKKLAETFPLCSLPRSLSGIQQKIDLSGMSFSGAVPFQERVYLFVIEDRESRKLVGSSQILARYAGERHPHFLLDEGDSSLCLKFVQSGAVQVGGLVLLPEFRRGPEKLGRCIGAVRFLYMLHEPEIWPKEVEVSLTAPLKDEDRVSDFWSAVGQKALSLDYQAACGLYQRDFSEFLSRIPSKMRIDLKSLPEGAQRAVRDIHPETRSLYRGLLKLGFRKTAYRHFLDGGIALKARREEIPFTARGEKVLWRFSGSSTGRVEVGAGSAENLAEGSAGGAAGDFVEDSNTGSVGGGRAGIGFAEKRAVGGDHRDFTATSSLAESSVGGSVGDSNAGFAGEKGAGFIRGSSVGSAGDSAGSSAEGLDGSSMESLTVRGGEKTHDEKKGGTKSPEPYLWGQQTGDTFKGGVIEGGLQPDGVFLLSQPPPAEMDPFAKLLVTPLNPTS